MNFDAYLKDFGLSNMTFGEFRPHAKYHHGMDALYYLTEDCSYRVHRISRLFSVLLHPQEAKIVGVKLKGIRYHFLSTKEARGLSEDDWLPLVKRLEEAVESGLGPTLTQRN